MVKASKSTRIQKTHVPCIRPCPVSRGCQPRERASLMPVQKNVFPGWGGLGLEKDPRAVYKHKSGRSKSTRAKEGNDPQELDATTPQDPGGVGEFCHSC